MNLRPLTLLALLAAAGPACGQFNHSQVFFDSSGTDQAGYGANQIITISGNVTYYGRRDPGPQGGEEVVKNIAQDFVQPASDIYIVPHGYYHGNPAASFHLFLEDVNGTPNTILGLGGGGFFEQQIASTAPQGLLMSGEYDLVVDEHQNGYFEPDFDLYLGGKGFAPAITVAIPVGAPLLPNPGIDAMKAAGNAEFKAAVRLNAAFRVIEIAYDKIAADGVKTTVKDVFKAIKDEFRKPPDDDAPFKLGFTAARNALANKMKHGMGLVADPPDPNFAEPVVLAPALRADESQADPLFAAAGAFANALDREALLEGALLSSLEKYQGAAAAQSGRWALAHARGVAHFARLLAGELARNQTVWQAMKEATLAGGFDFDALLAQDAALRARLQTSGFTAVEKQYLADLGLNSTRTEQALEKILAQPLTASKSAWLAALDAKIAAAGSGPAQMTRLATEMGAVVTALLAEPTLDRDDPVIVMGGPFTGTAGAPIALSATAVDFRGRAMTLEWDLDGDGEFDDATGASPSVTVAAARNGFAALRATNDGGRAAVAWAPLTVTSANQLPVFTAVTPAAAAAEVEAGATANFSLTATDPEGGPVSLRWTLDGNEVATGGSFAFTPAADQRGLSELAVTATDSAGGVRTRVWTLSITRSSPLADLSVTMEAPETPVQTGAEFTWTMTVENHGPSPAANVVLTQFLPAALTFVRSSTSFGTSSYSGGVVTANFGTVAAGGIVTMWVQTTAAAAGSFQNSATVSSAATDFENGNNSTSARVRVNAPSPQSAEVSLTATVAPSPATVGGTQTITFTTANAGPDGATGLILETQLPESVAFVSSTPAALSSDDGLVRIALPDVASGANTVASVVVRPSQAGSGPASARVFGAQSDPVLSSNEAEATLSAVFVPPATSDFTITQTAPALPRAGLPATWTITVTNNGPDAAANVSISDVLPAGAAFVSAVPPAASLNAGRASFQLGTLANGASRTVTLTVEPKFAGEAVNRVTAASASIDANGAASVSTVNVLAAPATSADLSASLTTPSATAALNADISFTLTLSNAGPDAATSVAAALPLPAGLEFVSATNGATHANGVITAPAATLASGGSAVFTIVLRAVQGRPYVVAAEVSSADNDNAPANNRAAASVLVNDPAAAVAIVQNFAAPEIDTLRGWLTDVGYTSQVFDQAGLTVDSLLPFKLVIWDDLGSAEGGIGTVEVDLFQSLTNAGIPLYFIGDDLARSISLLPATHSSRWSHLIRLTGFCGSVGSNAFQVFTPGHPLISGPYGAVSAPFPLGCDVDCDVEITAADVVGINLLAHCDPVTKARRVTQNWLPTCTPAPQAQAAMIFKNAVAWLMASTLRPDLAVTQTPGRNTVLLGSQVEVEVILANRGPAPAQDVVLTDALPAGLTYVSSTADRGTATFDNNRLTLRAGTMAEGEVIRVAVLLTAAVEGNHLHTVSAEACQPDPMPANNSSSATIAVISPPPALLRCTYRFDDTLAACEPDAPPLVAIDPANADSFVMADVNGTMRRVYRWDGWREPASAQAGLKLNTAGLLPRDNYTVEMLFRFTEDDSSARSILHTANRAGDHSLYVSPQNRIAGSASGDGPAPFVTGRFHHVTLTVAPDGTTATWLDGRLQRTETTSILNISAADLLHFFVDNDQGPAQTEYADGEIALMRVYEGVLPANRIAAQAAYPFGPQEPMDVNRDLNAVRNPIGVWTCGISETRGTPFLASPNPFVEPRWYVWNWSGNGPHIARNRTGASLSWLTIVQPPDLLCMDPSLDGRNAVVRWTAPAGGTYRVQGRWQGIDVSPNGTDAALLKNGSTATTLFETYVLGFGQAKPFDVTVTVAMGETVDFSLGRGGNSQYYDSTGLDAVITPLLLTDDCADGTDLAVTHAPVTKTAAQGDTIAMEILVTNAGQRPAPEVVLTDIIPAGLSFISAAADNGTVQTSGNVVTIALGTLAPGESLPVSVLLTGTAAGVFTNQVRVSSGSFDPALENNESSAVVTFGGVVPLVTTARTTVDSVTAGDEVVFELVMANGGTSAAPGCVLSVALPAGTAFVSATGGGALQSGTVTFPARSLAVSETAGYSLRLRTTTPGTLTITSLASSAQPSVREASGSASISVAPATVLPELNVALSTAPLQLHAGCRVTVTYTVTNGSPTPAADVTLRGIIPATLVVMSTTASQGTASLTGGQLNAALGRVLQGTPVTVTVEALATAAEPTGLSASVSGVHPFAAVPPSIPASLIHLWDFNEPAGAASSSTVLRDRVGTAHGAIRGAGAQSTGTGMKLPGGDQNSAAYIDLPNGLISPLQQVTFEGWVAINATGGNFSHILSFGSSEPGGANGEVFGPGNTNGGGWYGLDYISLTACVGTDYNSQRFAVRNAEPNGGGEPFQDSSGPTTFGQLVHIVVTADSSTSGSTTFRYYRDGILRSQLNNVPFNLSDLNDVNNWLGRGNYTDYPCLAATYDEFRLYNRALTPAEIEASRLAGPDALTAVAVAGFSDPAITTPSTASAFIRRNITIPPPGSPCAVPVALQIFKTPAQQSYRLEWSATPGRKFLIQSSPDLQRWINVPSLYTATQTNESWTDPGPPATERSPALDSERFYRVLELAE